MVGEQIWSIHNSEHFAMRTFFIPYVPVGVSGDLACFVTSVILGHMRRNLFSFKIFANSSIIYQCSDEFKAKIASEVSLLRGRKSWYFNVLVLNRRARKCTIKVLKHVLFLRFLPITLLTDVTILL